MDRLAQIKNKIERSKTYGLEPSVSLQDIEWLIAQLEQEKELADQYRGLVD